MSRIKDFTQALCDLSPVPRTYQSRPLCVDGIRRMNMPINHIYTTY